MAMMKWIESMCVFISRDRSVDSRVLSEFFKNIFMFLFSFFVREREKET